MLRKYASLAILDAEIETGAPVALRRTAHRVDFHYTPREGYLYVRSRMISSRCNDNFDEFPAEEIKGDGRTTGYVTFVGKPVFVNHHNEDHRRARGIILDAKLHEDTNPDGTPDTWVEGLMEVDAVRFPKLAAAILGGDIDRTSMGVDVERSTCSKCANTATTPLEYCRHIPALKGQRIRVITASGEPKDHLVRERCAGLRFFENSLLVEEPADPTAYFLDKPVAGPKIAATAARQERPVALEPKLAVHRCAVCFSRDTVTMLGHVECFNCEEVRPVPSRTASRRTAAGPRIPREQRTHEQDVNSFVVKEHPDPGTHPVWDHLGASEDNLVDHYNSASHDENTDGHRWYPDAELLAHHLGQSTGHGKHRVAATLAAYSPQMEWGINMHHAVRSLHTGQAVGPGEGSNVTDSHQFKAQKIMEGDGTEETHAAILNGPKTQAFNHLISHGGRDPVNGGKSQRVCVDVHAMSALCGRQLKGDDKKLGQKALGNPHFYAHAERMYQGASRTLSQQHGREISPSEVQAVTWGVRRRRNKEENPTDRNIKALETVERNNRGKHQEQYKDLGHDGFAGHSTEEGMRNLHANRGRRPFAERRAYGETKAPADIDTLRDEECPICGETTSYDGNTCSVCGFVQPPKEFQDPDLDLASRLDLRKDDADPNGMDVSDVQGVEDSINDADRDGIDDTTGLPMDEAHPDDAGLQPDLVCPVCGETFNSQPQSVSMENPMAGSEGPADPEQAAAESDEELGDGDPEQSANPGADDGNAAEGDVCPNCGQGVLVSPGEAQAEEGESPEIAEQEGQPGTGEPTDEGKPVDDDAPIEGDENEEPDDEDPNKADDAGHQFGSDDPDEEPADDDENDDGIPDEDEDDDDEEQKPAKHTPWQR